MTVSNAEGNGHDLGLGADVDPDDVDEGVVYTAGLSSAVLEDGEAIGHVLLLDLDDVEPSDVYKAVEATDGVRAVFESSPGSFHLWCLGVREWDEAILEGLSWGICDANHVQQSYRRGRYVLRIISKVRDDGSTYKEAPKLRRVYFDEGEYAVSRPHLAWIEQVAEEQGVEILSGDDQPTVELVGDDDGLIMDRYMTISDETKEAIR